MENLVDVKSGLTGLLVILSCHLVLIVIKMVLAAFKEKEATLRKELTKNNSDSEKELTEISMALRQNTDAIRELMVKFSVLEQEFGRLGNLKGDVQQLSALIKALAGPKWPKLRKAVADDAAPK